MKKTLSTMAAAAVLMASTAVAPALAQTATPAAPSAQTQTTMPSAATTGTTSAAGAGMTGEYLTEQAQNQISANDYIGKSIYNGEDKSIGSVTDLILEQDGGIVAAVVGVGGFLGIGQKNVAVPMDKITVTREADSNDIRLTTAETADALKAAPEFKTLDDQASTASTNGATDATTTSSTGGAATTPAPAAGGATAPSTTTQP
ncbi:sporulation protein YlmC with PRC-barrel domain [Neorhizobium galegae]|uniref:PRC-barrel domain-containing protein n=1 Tax=Rhizobium/Agrobacterium group TaxID=227290 RepID=UPI001AE77CBA|nr:PRC-barrel domain-containing protein [Neorhizobium galegae]MBP2547849.1 sporulation protein YlmC with PRC-barrel domain [Neorhizobium galegae]